MCEYVMGLTLNCIHIFIVTGSYFVLMCHEAVQSAFLIHSFIYLRIVIISYLATFLGTNSLSVLMCRKAINQSINQSCLNVCIDIRMLRLFPDWFILSIRVTPNGLILYATVTANCDAIAVDINDTLAVILRRTVHLRHVLSKSAGLAIYRPTCHPLGCYRRVSKTYSSGQNSVQVVHCANIKRCQKQEVCINCHNGRITDIYLPATADYIVKKHI